MTSRYVCVDCSGEQCLRCSGRGWVRKAVVQRERKTALIEAVARNLVEKQIAAIGPEEWARRASEENLTVDQYTEVEAWAATGPVKYQFMALDGKVIDAIADLAAIEISPVFVPDMRIVGWP